MSRVFIPVAKVTDLQSGDLLCYCNGAERKMDDFRFDGQTYRFIVVLSPNPERRVDIVGSRTENGVLVGLRYPGSAVMSGSSLIFPDETSENKVRGVSRIS